MLFWCLFFSLSLAVLIYCVCLPQVLILFPATRVPPVTIHLRLHAGAGFYKMADIIDKCPPMAKLFEGGILERRFQEVFEVIPRHNQQPAASSSGGQKARAAVNPGSLGGLSLYCCLKPKHMDGEGRDRPRP